MSTSAPRSSLSTCLRWSPDFFSTLSQPCSQSRMPANHAEQPRHGKHSAPRPARCISRYQLNTLPFQISWIETSLAFGKSSAVRNEMSWPQSEMRPSVSTLRRPDTGLLFLDRQICVQVFVQRFAGWNRRIVVPRQKLSRDHFVHADVFDPEVHSFLELALDCV